LNLGEFTEHRAVRECLQWFTREKQWINEQHLQLCRIPAPTFLEQERASWLSNNALLRVECLDRPGGNVIAAQGDGPYVAFTAHLDTVIAPRNKDEISVDPDGRFRGPASPINGAGLAALLALARAWRVAPAFRNFRSACCWWPTSARKARATFWDAAPLQAISAGPESTILRGMGWRQHRPHHHTRPRQPAF